MPIRQKLFRLNVYDTLLVCLCTYDIIIDECRTIGDEPYKNVKSLNVFYTKMESILFECVFFGLLTTEKQLDIIGQLKQNIDLDINARTPMIQVLSVRLKPEFNNGSS